LSESYNNPNVGTGKTLLVNTGFTINDGASGSNYSVSVVPNITGVITTRTLTVTGITANNKVYDGTTIATLNTTNAVLLGVVTGDRVTRDTSNAGGPFAEKNVGRGKTVTISVLALGGAQGGNYILVQPTVTANITPALLTLTATTNTKTYDATTS